MIHNLLFTNQLQDETIAIGIILAKDVHIHKPCPSLEAKLKELLKRRQNEKLNQREETFRKETRDLLRKDDFKPSGRNKPASEYLYKTVRDNKFPRVNSVVDINNFISLKYMVPISLWDLDLAGTTNYVFRLGQEEESYIFNESGQHISLKDLIVGCKIHYQKETPIINPVRDSMSTKITTSTHNIGAAIYYPLKAGNKDDLYDIEREFITLLECVTHERPEYDII